MNESTRAGIILVLIILILLALAFLGTTFLSRRAVKTVIRIFRDAGALDTESARTAKELGLQSRGMFQFRTFRDYKPAALQLLVKHEIIRFTEDGRFFLSEEALSQSGIEQRLG